MLLQLFGGTESGWTWIKAVRVWGREREEGLVTCWGPGGFGCRRMWEMPPAMACQPPPPVCSCSVPCPPPGLRQD